METCLKMGVERDRREKGLSYPNILRVGARHILKWVETFLFGVWR
jgi:hypothetical protein